MDRKRNAIDQINRDDFERGYDDVEDVPAATMKASDEVLAKRKIIMPKRRIDGSNSTGISFGGAPQASNPFGFMKSAGGIDQKNAKIRALNEQFVNAVNKKNVPNSLVDYTSVAESYIKYYKSIHEDSTAKPVEEPKSTFKMATHTPVVGATTTAPTLFSSKPTPPTATTTTTTTTTGGPQFSAPTTTSFQFQAKPQSQAAFSFSAGISQPPTSAPAFGIPSKAPDVQPVQTKEEPIMITSESEDDDEDMDEDEDKPEIKVQGPQFTLTSKPTTKSGPFTFDPKKLAKINAPDSDDSEDEVVIKGPTFQFNKPIVDSVFKLGEGTTKDKPAFSFGSNVEKKDEKPVVSFGATTEKPAFSFGSGSQPSENKPAFSFNSAVPEKKEDKPAFSFSQITEKKEDKPGFSFGSSNSTNDKPALFSFTQPSSEEKEDKPSFSFTPSEKKDDKPGFSFGSAQNNNSDKPSFSFTSSTNKETNPFSFGSSAPPPASSDKSNEKPGFSFGSSSTVGAETRPFSFGSSSETATKPLFSSTTDKQEEKPAFSFGTQPAVSEPPKFNFGGASSAFNNKSETETAKPVFNFAFNPSKSSNAGLFVPAESEEDDDKVPEEETGGDFAPIAQLSSEKMENVGTGEEDEELIYSKRCKLMQLDPKDKKNPYVNKGVGDLKILKHKETQKTRILIRTDGEVGRVLLNTLISKDLKYETMGNGSLVRIPTVDNSKQIVTYVVRVKTPTDGSELSTAITNVQ
ncbi:Nucleoporin NUP2 [Spathaspora sp. JA1]|nr:Nucleoporin NUP2 [Spathaspora sp. JA1]